MAKRIREHLHHCARSISCVLGVVLIWSGIGLILEYLQELYFPESPVSLGLICFAVGIVILYLPDKDLDELG